jgi:3-oxo-5alpha-steroid 4-dehydrogenase
MSANNVDGAGSWDEEADIVVVGFGGAGAATAIEAVDQGADTLVIERFLGGGATNISGGIYYGGGGTSHQIAAGFEDSKENMYNYLQQEVRGVVSDETLQRFVDNNIPDLEWLETNGVVFGSEFCPFKTSYPLNKYTLYYSGCESFKPFTDHAYAAPRGHRPAGNGLGGPNIYQPLKATALKKGVRLSTQTRAQSLITDSDGNVTGVEVRRLGGLWKKLHAGVSHLELGTRYLVLPVAPLRHITGGLYRLIESQAKTVRVRARKGVVLSSGGFIYNRKMVEEQDPRFLGGALLGTHGCDGSGIQMGLAVGGATGEMEKISAWRFINPPASFTRGMLVNRQGQRLCNEMLYGAKVGEYMCNDENNTEAFLIIDKSLWKSAHRDCLPEQSNWTQWGPALLNLYFNSRWSKSIEKLAMRMGINAKGLSKTLEEYNSLAAQGGQDDPLGKPPEAFQKLEAPYVAIDVSVGSKVFTCATLTMGGLAVNEDTGEVKREDGSDIKGLYAAGRAAVGVCSSGYMSGLAISDCVFSGRRASNHALGRD